MVYSLGLLFLQVLHPASETPFNGTQVETRLRAPSDWEPDLQGIDPCLAQILHRSLQPNPSERYPDLETMLADLEKAMPGGDTSRAVVRTFETDISELLSQAREAYEKTEFAKLRHLCESILDCSPSHLEARQLLAETEAKFEEAGTLYQLAGEQLDGGFLREAAELAREGATVYPNHPKARGILARLSVRVEQYRSMIHEGSRLATNQFWEMAAHYFEQAAEMNKGDVEVQGLARFFAMVTREIREKRSSIDTALLEGDIHKAIVLANSLDSTIEAIGFQVQEVV